MDGTTQFHDSSVDYENNLDVLGEHCTTLSGTQTPLSSLQTGVHSDDPFELSSLIPAALVRGHSDYTNWSNLAAVAAWELTDYKHLQQIPKRELDELIPTETPFRSMQKLIERAVTYHIDDISVVKRARETPDQESTTIGSIVRGGLQ